MRLPYRLLLSGVVGASIVFTTYAASPRRHPVVLLGVDGMEPRVLDTLRARGEMPNFDRLIARGRYTTITTDYGANSPVVWTTVATGVEPEVHGITGFAVATDLGTSPVSSTQRKVPALWTMATAAGLSVDVLGWWGTWPAEPVSGVVLSDRMRRPLENVLSPASFAPTFAADVVRVDASPGAFAGAGHGEEFDRMVAWYLAHPPGGSPPDLTVAYLHGIDLVSHEYWRYWDTEHFPSEPAGNPDATRVPDKYRAMDGALGTMVTAHPDANIILLSDHGFRALDKVFVKVAVSLDTALAKVGMLTSHDGAVDMASSRAYTYGSANAQMVKFVRVPIAGREALGTHAAAEIGTIRDDTARALARFTYEVSGAAVFGVRAAVPAQKAKGADFVVEVLPDGAGRVALLDARRAPGVVTDFKEHSGGHGMEPPGVFIAAGPDIQPGVKPEPLHVHDVAPTVLYALGLPVGADGSGKAHLELFSAAFVKANPPKSIPTWGHHGGRPTPSSADEDMADMLRQLGYIE